MKKMFGRKFLLLFATYAALVVFFALGRLSDAWFCGSMLAMSLFYYIANVWQKKIFESPQSLELLEKTLLDIALKLTPGK